jgi:hypothetical protein
VINQILSAIDDVIKAVENRIVENEGDFDDEDSDEPGHFVSRLDEVGSKKFIFQEGTVHTLSDHVCQLFRSPVVQSVVIIHWHRFVM